MDDVKTRLRSLLRTLTENEEYILGVLDNAPHPDDMEFLCNYIENNPAVSISDIILYSCELGMIRDGELEPLPDDND